MTVQTVSFTPKSAFPLKGHRKIELPKCQVRKEKCFGKLLTVQTVSFTPRSAFLLKGHRKIELPKCQVFVTVPESNIYTLQLFCREKKNVWAVKRG